MAERRGGAGGMNPRLEMPGLYAACASGIPVMTAKVRAAREIAFWKMLFMKNRWKMIRDSECSPNRWVDVVAILPHRLRLGKCFVPVGRWGRRPCCVFFLQKVIKCPENDCNARTRATL